jgi:hypothetical protein
MLDRLFVEKTKFNLRFACVSLKHRRNALQKSAVYIASKLGKNWNKYKYNPVRLSIFREKELTLDIYGRVFAWVKTNWLWSSLY